MKSIAETLQQHEQLSQFWEAMQTAHLESLLANEYPLTVLAPVNTAFTRLPEGTWQLLLDDPEALEATIKYHILPDSISSTELATCSELTNLQGKSLQVYEQGKVIEQAQLLSSSITCQNGNIYLINALLQPGTLEERSLGVM